MTYRSFARNSSLGFILALFVFSANVFAVINSGTYPYSTASGVALEDMSGSTPLFGITGDDEHSTIQNIGFTFGLDGTNYTTFGVNANGYIRLGSVTGNNSSYTNSLGTDTDSPKIAPFWDDLCVGDNAGAVHYKIVGSAPNRKLVVEWKNMLRWASGGCNANGTFTFQAWLSEVSNRIDFVYGGAFISNAAVTYSTGFQSGTATNYANVLNGITPTATYGTGVNNAQTFAIVAGTQHSFAPPPPTMLLGSTSFSGSETTGTATITVNRVGPLGGAANVDVVTSDGTATSPGDYTGGVYNASFSAGSASTTVNIPITDDATFDPGESFNITLATPTGGTIGTPSSATVAIADNEAIPSGTYSVGSGGTFTSLTNGGGVFASINAAGVSGPITIEIISDLTGETGSNALNAIPGNPAITIKPTGELRTITSTATAFELIAIDGADNVTIDGSLSGGTDRNLVINSTSTASQAVTVLATLGSDNFTLRNSVIRGNSSRNNLSAAADENYCVYALAPGLLNTTIVNNDVGRCQWGVLAGGTATEPMAGLTITDNVVGNDVLADSVGRFGIYTQYVADLIMRQNTIKNITYAAGANGGGIWLAAGTIDSEVVRNNITNLNASNVGGYGMTGITISTSIAASNLTVANNFVSDIKGTSWSTAFLSDTVVGIRIFGTNSGGINLYYNTVNLFGDYAGSNPTGGTVSAAFMVNATTPTALDVRNNIFVNSFNNTSSTTDRNYAIFTNSANTMFTAINNNDYFVSGAQGVLGAINSTPNRTTLADLQTATGQDAASVSVDPIFASPTDLHISDASPVIDLGVVIPSVIDDFDGNLRGGGSRGGGTTDIGADERFAPTAADASLGGRITTQNGNGIAHVKVTVSGGSLAAPVSMTTGPFGYFNFSGLEAGQTYIVMVNSKIYFFAKPVRAVTLSDTITDVDFVAEN